MSPSSGLLFRGWLRHWLWPPQPDSDSYEQHGHHLFHHAHLRGDSTIRYQQNDYYCGPAALQNALKVLRRHVTQDRIAELAGTTEDEGTDEEGLTRAAVALGFGVDPIEASKPMKAWGHLGYSLFVGGRPVILCVDRWSHWVTAIGICGSHVLLAEPGNYGWAKKENGILVVNRDRFLRRWVAARKVRKRGPAYYGLAVGPVT